jgi:hypothetical protein
LVFVARHGKVRFAAHLLEASLLAGELLDLEGVSDVAVDARGAAEHDPPSDRRLGQRLGVRIHPEDVDLSKEREHYRGSIREVKRKEEVSKGTIYSGVANESLQSMPTAWDKSRRTLPPDSLRIPMLRALALLLVRERLDPTARQGGTTKQPKRSRITAKVAAVEREVEGLVPTGGCWTFRTRRRRRGLSSRTLISAAAAADDDVGIEEDGSRIARRADCRLLPSVAGACSAADLLLLMGARILLARNDDAPTFHVRVSSSTRTALPRPYIQPVHR